MGVPKRSATKKEKYKKQYIKTDENLKRKGKTNKKSSR